MCLCFSALQRAEIAEIEDNLFRNLQCLYVSVLFNEPKLLKLLSRNNQRVSLLVSVLFNEPKLLKYPNDERDPQHYLSFQCSSTSRNC